LIENKSSPKTTLRENETTLFDNRPITSALDHINANSNFSFGLALDGFCDDALGAGQKEMTAKLQEAIGLYEKATEVYEGADQNKWAATQTNCRTVLKS
jgi:hypothetical protein